MEVMYLMRILWGQMVDSDGKRRKKKKKNLIVVMKFAV